jgi:hypothetical protein
MIQRTAAEQARALRWHRHRQETVTPRALLRESDELMYGLEECLVQGMKLVPGWMTPRLTRVISAADAKLVGELRHERRPEKVIEILYRAQDELMRQAIKWREPARIIPLFRKRKS